MSVKEDPNDNTLGVKIATTGSAQGRSHNQGVKNKPIQNRNLPKYILSLRHPRQCTRSTSDTSGKPVGKPACCHYPEPLLTTLVHGVRLDTSLSLVSSSSSLSLAPLAPLAPGSLGASPLPQCVESWHCSVPTPRQTGNSGPSYSGTVGFYHSVWLDTGRKLVKQQISNS